MGENHQYFPSYRPCESAAQAGALQTPREFAGAFQFENTLQSETPYFVSYNSNEWTRRQELFRAGLSLAPGIVFQREMR
jgi:hypothetical protein